MEMQQTKMRNKLADQDYEMSTSTDPEGQSTTSTATTSTTDKQHREDAAEKRRIQIEDEIINIRQYLDDPLMWEDEDHHDELRSTLKQLEDELQLFTA